MTRDAHLLQDVFERLGVFLSAQPPHVQQQRCVRAAVAEPRAHRVAAVRRVEHVSVHAALPDLDRLGPAAVARQLLLRGGAAAGDA